MIKEEFYYESRDGKSKIHAIRYTPEGNMEPCAVVQIVHGMAEYFERYEEFAEFLTGKGFVVVGEDHIGHGKSVGKKGRCGYFCEGDAATVVIRDVHRLKKMTQEIYSKLPYVIMGHSMGSFIVRNYITRYGTGVEGSIIMGTGMVPLPLVRMSKMMAGLQALFLGDEHVSKFIDKLAFGSYNDHIESPATPFDWLTRDANRVAKYVADPMCGFLFTVNGFATLFELIYRLYNTEILNKIPKTLPILMISGKEDPVGEYGKGVQRAYESLCGIGMKNVGLKMYDGARHELLNETNREEVFNDIYRWLEANILQTEEEETVIEKP